MRHTITVKFIAILLAALCLVTVAGSAIGIALLTHLNQYAMDFETWYAQTLEEQADRVADCVAERYAAEQLSNCTEDMLEHTWVFHETDAVLSQWMGLYEERWTYQIADIEGTVLEAGKTVLPARELSYTEEVTAQYPVFTDQKPEQWDLTYEQDGYPRYLQYETGPVYTVTVYMMMDAMENYNGLPIGFLELFFGMRYGFIVLLIVGLLLFAVCAVYLCCAAGKTARDSEARPGGLNRMPLDLYLAVAGIACILLVMLAFYIVTDWFYENGAFNLGVLGLAAIVLTVAAVIGIGFFFAVAAQFKMPRFYWWHNSVIGWCLDKVWKGIRFVVRLVLRLVNMLPVIWKYLLIGGAMVLIPLIFLFSAYVGRDFGLFFLFLSVLADVGIVGYGAYAYGTLLRGAERMTRGNLNTKISTKYLIGSYKACARHLNALADVATVAAQNQLKSERMKTELITNVSHDIKTPLTSIINYVDLLGKPHTEQEGDQYLEVLGRQSQRLKKLIEDLMEMSKATTGNMTVEIGKLDAAEAVNQALGEFADKLAAAQLQPVFRQAAEQAWIAADGRLTWRVLSNLLSNIVKYALPGTRVYIDLMQLDDCVTISLKNISREELNVSADELTERFVRGDVARNTEGSGLGLNIAKSLMDLQKGQLQLLVDGDLFKVTLVFPLA